MTKLDRFIVILFVAFAIGTGMIMLAMLIRGL